MMNFPDWLNDCEPEDDLYKVVERLFTEEPCGIEPPMRDDFASDEEFQEALNQWEFEESMEVGGV